MFLGVVHANARKVIASYVSSLPANAHIICSGNFSIETTLRLNGYQGKISGCDVSIYTCMLGLYFSGQDGFLELNEEYRDEFADLVPFLENQQGRAAAVAVMLDLAEHIRQKNDYQRRMYNSYMRHLTELMEGTCEKLERKKQQLRLDEFYPQDGQTRIHDIPDSPDHAVLSFPPTYSGGYEKLYAVVDEIFSWQQPEYMELTSGADFARRIVEKPNPWILGAELPDQDLEDVTGKPVAVCDRGTQVKVYLYSNIDDEGTKLVRRKTAPAESKHVRLSDDDEITEDSVLGVHQISSVEADYVRQVYASVEVGQAPAQYCYAVTVDGKLIGILMFQDYGKANFMKDGQPMDIVYMMADITISSERYKRLSKLVLMASCSVELKDMLENRCIKQIEYIMTTAFSNNPVSMKYRGLFKMYSRKEEGGLFKLNYYAPADKFTLKEALKQWLKKYNKA